MFSTFIKKKMLGEDVCQKEMEQVCRKMLFFVVRHHAQTLPPLTQTQQPSTPVKTLNSNV